MADTPEFDPLKPFETIGAPNAAPEFDPSRPFETIGEKPNRGVLERAGQAVLDTGKAGVSAIGRMLTPPEDVSGYRGPAGMLRSFKETGQGLLGLATPVTAPLAGVESLAASGLGAGLRAVEEGIAKVVEQVSPEKAAGLRAKIPTSEEAYESTLPFAGAALSAIGSKGMRAKLPTAEEAMARPPDISFPKEFSRALERDSDAPEALMGRLEEARKVNPQATLADVGGENVRGIVERLAQTPSAGKQIVSVLGDRQRGQLGRITRELSTLTGDTRSAYRAIEDTMAIRQKSATPYYQQAYTDGDTAIWSPGLEQISGAPFVQAAMRRAVSGWRNQAIADGYGAMNPGASVERGGILELTSGKVPVFPNLQFWDYTKQQLDGMIAQALRAGAKQKARTLTNLVTKLRGELDAQVPSYANARNAWAGPSKYLDAVDEGRTVLNKNITAEELSAEFGQLSNAEQEGFRLGAFSSIINRMRSNPAKMPDFTRELRSPEMRAKISALMPNKEAVERYNKALDFEIRSAELAGQALTGSPTARRLAMQADAENDALEVVGELGAHFLTHGASIPFMRQSGRGILSKIQKSILDKVRSKGDKALAGLLMSTRSPTEITGPFRRPPKIKFPSRMIGRGTVLAPAIENPEGFRKGGRVTRSFHYRGPR